MIQNQEKATDEENDPSEGQNILKILSHLTNVLKETTSKD